MKSLQLWLAVLGGLVLAAVIAHGAWQTRRAGGGRRLPPLDAAPSRHLEPRFDDAGLAANEGAPTADGEVAAPVPPKPPRRVHKIGRAHV